MFVCEWGMCTMEVVMTAVPCTHCTVPAGSPSLAGHTFDDVYSINSQGDPMGDTKFYVRVLKTHFDTGSGSVYVLDGQFIT